MRDRVQDECGGEDDEEGGGESDGNLLITKARIGGTPLLIVPLHEAYSMDQLNWAAE